MGVGFRFQHRLICGCGAWWDTMHVFTRRVPTGVDLVIIHYSLLIDEMISRAARMPVSYAPCTVPEKVGCDASPAKNKRLPTGLA